jgi:ABC-type transport system substrate-binding protein
MLHRNRLFALLIALLLLVQPVFAESEPSEPTVPDIVTAVKTMQTLPADISPLTPATEEKLFLRALTSVPLYALDGDGKTVPVLAAALPEDVTADYAGSFDIPAAARRGYAYRIPLHADARWEDGTAVTAQDVVYSVRKLFAHQQTAADWQFLSGAVAVTSGKRHTGSNIISLRDAGFSSVTEAWSAGYVDFYLDTEGFWGLGGGWKPISDRIRLRDFAMPGGLDEYFVSPAYLYRYYLMDGAINNRDQAEFIGIPSVSGAAYTIEDLGILATSEKELIVLTQTPMTAATVIQKLDALFLFRSDAAEGQLLSYGPYRTVSADTEQILLEPNPHWWGASDIRGYDRILCRKIGT